MNIQENYRMWCEDSCFDKATKEELKGISEEEIRDRFYKDLEFGTGGLRGKIGAGTNRMNIYTVRKTTQGLANYVILKEKCENGVAIAYDSRHLSPEFAKEAALCLNANGIKTYLFESLRPTPELSFALRYLHCVAGIVITASHNPAEYNGYKVYWEDGAQITAPMDQEIQKQVALIQNVKETKSMDVSNAIKQGLYHMIGKEIDDAYQAELIKLVIHPECIKKTAKSLKIVYSPIHGTGNLPVQNILKKLGFEKVFVVKEQETPDGAFPTVVSPNPEDAKAFTMGLKLAKEVDADLVLATDPDADRLGVYAKDNHTGQYHCFTGNMSGILIGEYETAQRKALGTLPVNGAWVRTIVTSKMADEITKKYNLKMIEVLTGFKYIGEQIKWMEESRAQEYVFGFEESYGCLVGTHARDKDAVAAVMALCEAAAFYQCQGITLWDRMLKLYEEFGYFKEDLASITFEGLEGLKQMHKLMDQLRKNPVTELASHQVLKIRDYKNSIITDLVTGRSQAMGLPVSDVIYYELSDQAWVCFRPSGTEPKMKLYCGVKGDSQEDATQKLNFLMQETVALTRSKNMIKCKTCEMLVKEYNNNKKHITQTEKIIFAGVQGRDVYNITAPFWDNGSLVIAGRVEKRDSEDSQVLFFIENNGTWVPRENSKVLHLQDPFFTFINGELIVGGVQTFPHPTLNNALGWRTVFYKGADIDSLQEYLKGPDGMKDLRLVQLQDKRIGIFTRPQGEKGGRGKIGFTIVNTLEDVSIEIIQQAPLIENQFAEGEWGGTNEIHLCKDGLLGVLGHIACFDQFGDRHYYSMTFLFDPTSNKVLSPIKILAVRGDFLPSLAKRKDLEDVVFSGGLVRKGDGSAVLYAGIGDADAQWIVLEDPFAGY